MEHNFIFSKVEKEYFSLVPKCYREICKTSYISQDNVGFTRRNRADPEVLRYLEFKILGRLLDVQTATVEDLEQEYLLTNIALEKDLDLDRKTSTASVKRLVELGFISVRYETNEFIRDNKPTIATKRFVSLNCENIKAALDKYFETVKKKRKKESKERGKEYYFKLEEGYYDALLKKESRYRLDFDEEECQQVVTTAVAKSANGSFPAYRGF